MAFLFKLLAFVGILIISFYYSLHAEQIQGKAIVIDSDTLEMHGIRLRLHGADAPESGQFCFDSSDETYGCGQAAALSMESFVGVNMVICTIKDKDRYGRLVVECFVNGKNINKQLLRDGFALAFREYSNDYTQDEEYTSKAKAGVWQGQFIKPWDWRRGERLARDTHNQSDRCQIKGNISKSGKIYYIPGSPWYEKTKINTDKCERWFCTEEEAKAAGWRAKN